MEPKNYRVYRILPVSLFIHVTAWIFVVQTARGIHPNLVGATYGQLSPAALYLAIILVGHAIGYYLAQRSERAVLALLVFMVYCSLVLIITLLRLQGIDYVTN